MTRKYIDCREFPSEMNCSIALSADSDQELLDAAVQHALTVHKHTDSPELRAQLKTLVHDGAPPVEAPRAWDCRQPDKTTPRPAQAAWNRLCKSRRCRRFIYIRCDARFYARCDERRN